MSVPDAGNLSDCDLFGLAMGAGDPGLEAGLGPVSRGDGSAHAASPGQGIRRLSEPDGAPAAATLSPDLPAGLPPDRGWEPAWLDAR